MQAVGYKICVVEGFIYKTYVIQAVVYKICVIEGFIYKTYVIQAVGYKICVNMNCQIQNITYLKLKKQHLWY